METQKPFWTPSLNRNCPTIPPFMVCGASTIPSQAIFEIAAPGLTVSRNSAQVFSALSLFRRDLTYKSKVGHVSFTNWDAMPSGKMLEDVLRLRYVGLLCPHQKNFVQMKTLFPPPDPGLSMHSYKIVIYRCKCGAHSPRGTKRIQLMVCVPIVPVRYDSEDPVRPNGQPCEIWRNVNNPIP